MEILIVLNWGAKPKIKQPFNILIPPPPPPLSKSHIAIQTFSLSLQSLEKQTIA
ncbi:hypothetical protein [Helicobacter bilis]|uniref:hypothetical protein n=1 Tax=Helicobacter bilis TaxID=37372 RepID=UPI002A82661F|nr:hypothetical protein [Helicobacter bilis]MDY4399460.1 hypothetical protein [Helicobacter bilis]